VNLWLELSENRKEKRVKMSMVARRERKNKMKTNMIVMVTRNE